MVGINKYILVVDDSKQYQLIYKTYLDKIFQNEVEIVNAMSSEDCLKSLDSGKIPDLILLDYILPDTNGVETLKKIRAKNSYKDIPVLFLTGYGDEHVAKEALKNGADDYLSKSCK